MEFLPFGVSSQYINVTNNFSNHVWKTLKHLISNQYKSDLAQV